MAKELRKTELTAELARARSAISANVSHLRSDLDVVHRIEHAFRRHQLAWITGAGLCGFLLARLPARTRKVVAPRKKTKHEAEETAVKAGLLVTTLKLVFDVARPALTKWLARRVATYAQSRFAGGNRV